MRDAVEPRDVVHAVVHPDPYPYYARLRRDRPLYFDEGLDSWVATTAPVVLAAMGEAALLVRPPEEPVPRALAGTPAGEVFARLVRMNDGEFHARHKPAVQQASSRLPLESVARSGADAAMDLADRVDANALLRALPVQAMARVLGVPADALDRTTGWVEDFVKGIAAQAPPEALARANHAAQALMAQGEAQGLDAVQCANRIALMQQSLDACAGLLGNAVRHQRLRGADITPQGWRAFVAEVSRWDAPVQNTRRFAGADVMLGGQRIGQGQAMVLVLASANRDPRLNPDPDAFEPNRAGRTSLSFGAGRHQCPGEAIAVEIVAAALGALQSAGRLERVFGRTTGFRALPNARIPVFEAEGA